MWTAMHLRRFNITAEDNLVARKHYTQTRILQRVAKVLLIAIVTVGLALMTIAGFRQWGVSLLASAGVVGIIAGLALQPVLTNLLAGIQIALTQPIRIDDAVIVENEWGNVEEITATYVVVKLWDWRRMVLPLSWFITNPFQNWTRENARLIGTAMFYVDYAAPIDRLREAFERIVQGSKLWDGDVQVLQVTDVTERVAGPLPGQRPVGADRLRPALRDPREADGLHARRMSGGPAEGIGWIWNAGRGYSARAARPR
jgi:small-conductance mechanosensitive channel